MLDLRLCGSEGNRERFLFRFVFRAIALFADTLRHDVKITYCQTAALSLWFILLEDSFILMGDHEHPYVNCRLGNRGDSGDK